MVDVVPQLAKKLKRGFESGVGNNIEIQRLQQKIRYRNGTYADAEEIAKEIGSELSKTFEKNLSSTVLPDGKMYYNIADRAVRPLLEESYTMAIHEAMEVQRQINEKAHISISVQKPVIDKDRVEGIINSLSNAEQFDNIAWLLEEPLINFVSQAVTDVVRDNFEFHGRAGLNPKIIRTAENKCCDWCRSLAGTYRYPVENRDVFRRHQRCRCSVIYDQGDGFRENVHTRQQLTSAEQSKTTERKTFGLRDKSEELQRRELRKLIGMKVANKTVTGYSDQIIENLQKRTVTMEALKDTLTSPLSLHQNEDSYATEILGSKCAISMSQSGKLIDVHSINNDAPNLFDI